LRPSRFHLAIRFLQYNKESGKDQILLPGLVSFNISKNFFSQSKSFPLPLDRGRFWPGIPGQCPPFFCNPQELVVVCSVNTAQRRRKELFSSPNTPESYGPTH